MFWTPHILRAFCCCMARGTGPGISNYYHERIRGVTKNASVKVQHEIGRKTAAYTAKRLSKCCNYCIVAVLVAGGSTQNVSLSVVAAKGCPTKISQMLDQGAWRISHLCRGCRRSAATVWIWGKKIMTKPSTSVVSFQVLEPMAIDGPRCCITDICSVRSIRLSTFFSAVVWLTAGAACDKKGQILATPNAAMGVLDENHGISALMHGSLIL